VISHTTPEFRKLVARLPVATQLLAKKQFDLFKTDPTHPSLEFKSVARGLWSARVSLRYRALAERTEQTFLWVWIGTHAEYDRILRAL